jgi:MinD superfamily P-loop ATPase
MIITVASGKGGTGKTTVATSLAISLAAELNPPPLFLDCDVEAPNAHLYLHPEIGLQKEVAIPVPVVDEALCTHCGKCAEVCQYNAIAVLGKQTLVFPQLCHGCGSCAAICPEKAIQEVNNRIGVIEMGKADEQLSFARGVLDVGEPMAVPVIRQLKKWSLSQPGQVVIRDASPGTSCPVVEAVYGSDYVFLVTEPTPFGMHDLRLAAEMVQMLGLRAGVIVNRQDGSYPPVEAFCNEQSLPIVLCIPFERTIAMGIAQGKRLVDIHPEFRSKFLQIFTEIVCSSREYV